MIKNIIFDLGGVLYDIDFARTTAALADLGIPLTEENWVSGQQQTLIDTFERGVISTDEFIAALQRGGDREVSRRQVEQACCALLLGFTQQRLTYLQQLRNKYAIYLLSNTNPLHLSVVEAELNEKHSIGGLSDLFIHPYTSFTMGLRKPDLAIYTTVLQEQQLVAAETLFVDDSKLNTDAAAACGLQVLHKPADVELCQALPEYLEVSC
jgi:glucose-1-phosphatase